MKPIRRVVLFDRIQNLLVQENLKVELEFSLEVQIFNELYMKINPVYHFVREKLQEFAGVL